MARIAKRRPRRLHVLIGLIVVLAIVAAYVWVYAPQYLPQYLAQFAPPQNQRGQAGGQGGHFGLRGDAPVPVLVAGPSRGPGPGLFCCVGSGPWAYHAAVRR